MTKKLFLTMTLLAAAATMFVACGDKDDDNEPEVVDLGLPSGTLWTKTNLGAKNAWDFGDYFAWGETQPKTDYSWETYKHCDGTDTSLTKYCYNAICGKNGFTDIVGDFDMVEGLTTLESADDAATAVLGADYSMPTEADWRELRSQCYWEWTWEKVLTLLVDKSSINTQKPASSLISSFFLQISVPQLMNLPLQNGIWLSPKTQISNPLNSSSNLETELSSDTPIYEFSFEE